MIKLITDYSSIDDLDVMVYQSRVSKIHNSLIGEDTYSENLGWFDYPNTISEEEIEKIETYSEEIVKNSDVLIIIGTGGSYIGSRSVIEALKYNFYYQIYEDSKIPKIYFLGYNLSDSYVEDLLKVLENKEVSVNVISKSGSTIETVLAYTVIEEFMKKKYGDSYKDRVYITTSMTSGPLRELAIREGIKSLDIPNKIGGRYSVLTPVGLLAMAVSGINIRKVLKGASEQKSLLESAELTENPAYLYAVMRNILYKNGKQIELLVTYEPKLRFFSEWWQQLFAESEGKDGKGLFPTYAFFSTDLHSLGQIIQDGKRNLFETVLMINESDSKVRIENIDEVFGRYSSLEGKNIGDINKMVFESTIAAHSENGVPNIILEVKRLDEERIGALIYFFLRAVSMSGILLGVNPFNQPGVEIYKRKLRERFK